MARMTREALLAWYGENARDLPWRHTHDPYAIFVSEVMLQQTQVVRVVPRYEEWLERWPTVETLAAATPADVIQAWSGLGYNRRAVNLHRCAQAVVARGGFPRRAGGAPEAARHRARTPPRRSPASHSAPRSLLPTPTPFACSSGHFPASTSRSPQGRAYEWNQALFDLGREVCIARKPRCGACPLESGCPSRGRTYAPLRRQTRFEGSFRQRRARLLQRDRRGRRAARGRLRRRGARLARPRRPRRGLRRRGPAARSDEPCDQLGQPVERAAARRPARSPPAAPGRPG